MLLSCADQSFSQQLQPPKSSRKRAVSTFSPFSATPQQRASPRSALQAYLRENLFLKALIVFAIMGAISATEEGKKAQINQKKPHMKAAVTGWESRAVQSCFLHGKRWNSSSTLPASFPKGAALSCQCPKQLHRHRGTAGRTRQGFCCTGTIRAG